MLLTVIRKKSNENETIGELQYQANEKKIIANEPDKN